MNCGLSWLPTCQFSSAQ